MLPHLLPAQTLRARLLKAKAIHLDDLLPGDRVEVTWLPNRRCVFRYEGEAHFIVVESENAKLKAGDSFDAACFLIGKPMYLDNVQRRNTQGAKEGISYVAGSKNGLNSVKLADDK